VPREKQTVRQWPFNAFSHCKNCHIKLGGGIRHISKTKTISKSGDPARFYRHYVSVFGSDYAEAVLRFSEITFKNAKHWQGEIRDHYKSQYKMMDELRKDGHDGRIEFEPWTGAHPLNLWLNILHEVQLDRSKNG
jgi:hypothetical protein